MMCLGALCASSACPGWQVFTLFWPLSGLRNGAHLIATIIDVWNSVLQGIPPMRHWTVERLMERVNRIDGIDLGWRNYLRERYDV